MPVARLPKQPPPVRLEPRKSQPQMTGGDVTELLHRWRGGNNDALGSILQLLEGELRQMARSILRGDRQRHLLDPTELVHEAVLRTLHLNEISWADRAHFLALMAMTMRRVVVDEARKRHAARRARVDVTLTEHLIADHDAPLDLLAIDRGLRALHELSPERARVVEMKVFGGMTSEEIGEVLGLSEATVKRRWRAARAWLAMHLSGDEPDEGAAEAGPQEPDSKHDHKAGDNADDNGGSR